MFADEPTGNLDSRTSSEILELLRDSVSSYGQTTVMVTHDAHAAAIADRILFLADGLIVNDLGPSTAARDPRGARGGDRPVIRVALKGVLGRKLRAALTAFAIVLGVAMISGSLVLTDTVSKSFDGVYGESYKDSDAVVSSKAAIADSSGKAAGVLRRRAAEGAARRRRARGAGLDRGRGPPRQRSTATRSAPRLGRRRRARRLRRPEPQPVQARVRSLAGRRRADRDRQGDGEGAALRGRRHRRRLRRRAR